MSRDLRCAGISVLLLLAAAGCSRGPQTDAKRFLETYNNLAQKLTTVSAEAGWKASTDVTDEHTGERIGADRALAVFAGSDWVLKTSKTLLDRDRKSTRLNSSHIQKSRMPSSA